MRNDPWWRQRRGRISLFLLLTILYYTVLLIESKLDAWCLLKGYNRELLRVLLYLKHILNEK